MQTALPAVESAMPHKVVRGQREILEAIGLRIAAARKRKGVTQVQLAKALHISQVNVSGYERGTVRIPSDQLLAIAQVLDVSTDELLGMKPPRVPEPTPPMGRRLRQRLELLERLPKRDQDALTRFLDAWVSKLKDTGRRSKLDNA